MKIRKKLIFTNLKENLIFLSLLKIDHPQQKLQVFKHISTELHIKPKTQHTPERHFTNYLTHLVRSNDGLHCQVVIYDLLTDLSTHTYASAHLWYEAGEGHLVATGLREAGRCLVRLAGQGTR